MSRDTVSPKSITGTRKKKEQSQGGEGSTHTSTGTASWQAPAQRPEPCVICLWEAEEGAFWWGKRLRVHMNMRFPRIPKGLETQGLSHREEEVANGIERLGRIDPPVWAPADQVRGGRRLHRPRVHRV